ncbi:hypothetical protein BDV06DRAFT_76119 [Aspergillus oleicola]
MDEDELLRIHSILHLIFHRNRNQHGRTKWWKWLSILKRTVWELAISSNPGDKGGSRSSAEHSRRYLANRILPRCYVAFSVVVADAQFSTLGTVLLATLAQLSKITGIDKELKARPRIEPSHDLVSSPRMESVKEKEDIGETLSRPADVPDLDRSSNPKKAARSVVGDTGRITSSKDSAAKVSDTAKPKEKKEKKKGKNAIDDLFSGLL